MNNELNEKQNKVLIKMLERKRKMDEAEQAAIEVSKNKVYDEKFWKEEPEEENPYEISSWAGCEWFCFLCGSKLKEISKENKHWNHLWQAMLEDGTLYFLCSNKDCCHFDSPLVLHHPIKSYHSPAGDSYSLSWVK